MVVKTYGFTHTGKQGFTILELVVSIFLIAIVLGGVLLLMAANLNVLDKANDIIVANALVQYTLEDIQNIEFPPVLYDRQKRFGDRPSEATAYKRPGEINPVNDGGDWTPEPEELQNRYIIRRYNFRYMSDGSLITHITDDVTLDTDIANKHRVDVYILRRHDNSVISRDSIVISRDGLF